MRKTISDKQAYRIVKRLQNRPAQVVYTIESMEGLYDALIAEADKVGARGSERKIYIYDTGAKVFPCGHGIAMLYRHEGGPMVIADIMSAGKRYCVNITRGDQVWKCSDMVQLMTSADSYNKQEVHDAIAGYGYTCGMVRDFDSQRITDAYNYDISGQTFPSKLYTILLTKGTKNYPITIDHKQILVPSDPQETGAAQSFVCTAFYVNDEIDLCVTYTRYLDGTKMLRFETRFANGESGTTGYYVKRVCGYY